MAGGKGWRQRETAGNRDALPVRSDATADASASDRLDDVVLSIARLIGRRMAREEFAAREASLRQEEAAGASCEKAVGDDVGEKP